MAGKVSKNQMKSSGKSVIVEGVVKYSDPRMAYVNTKSELVIKESDKLVMKDIFGENILCKNEPVILCEDQNGYYLTGKDLIDALVLDVYRNYKRNQYEIRKVEENYYVTVNGNEYMI